MIKGPLQIVRCDQWDTPLGFRWMKSVYLCILRVGGREYRLFRRRVK